MLVVRALPLPPQEIYNLGIRMKKQFFVQHNSFHIEKELHEMAYFNWLNAGCPINRDIEFWTKAEREICLVIQSKRLVIYMIRLNMTIFNFVDQLQSGLLEKPKDIPMCRYNAMCLWVTTRFKEGYKWHEMMILQ